MQVEFSSRGVIVRADAASRWWAAPFLLLGAAIVGAALLTEVADSGQLVPLVVILGFGVAATGGLWLVPRDTLVFDTVAREVRETTYSLAGRKVKRLSFAMLATIGIETLQDPETSAVWSTVALLRRKDGRRWTIDGDKFPFAAELDGGRGSHLLEQIGRAAGLEVFNETKLRAKRPRPVLA